MKSIRIGNKKKSVRVKKYILDFYAEMIGLSFEEACLDAVTELEQGCLKMRSDFVTGDYVAQRLLVYIAMEYGQ